ncbi:unnamed protein product [Acanthoscelides obtectus]|uniref:PiggyBac transposable element-derived protein domain-containing protein n=1 Tax=Acanthoscelides obtectus TaxID=200917 RepID=A0A9P0LT30_ACAOB|nr:unnamed protein product [Acanthoscelides obtectus]CAK1664018.1 PiggyBac transposable element-derived protein 2 [Acanthoscelides obtectus]
MTVAMILRILIWMSLIKQPNSRRYWSPNTRIDQVADVIPVNRFEEIKRFLHFTDNQKITTSTDKITLVFNQIKSACQKVPLEENLSCDEQIVPFKGRISLKTYNPKKPHKWGYKIWVLSGRVTKAEDVRSLLQALRSGMMMYSTGLNGRKTVKDAKIKVVREKVEFYV